MSDPEASDRVSRLRAEGDPAARARLLGIDYAALKRSTFQVWGWTLAVLLALVVLLAFPAAVSIVESHSPASRIGFAPVVVALLSMFVLYSAIEIVVRVLALLLRRFGPRAVGTSATIAYSVLEVFGVFIVVVVSRETPETVIGIVSGSVFRAAYFGSAAASLLPQVWRNSPRLASIVDLHRTLPPTSTTLANRPAAVVSVVAARGLVSIALATVLWLDPALVVALALVSAGVMVGALKAQRSSDLTATLLVLWGWGVVLLAFALVAGREY